MVGFEPSQVGVVRLEGSEVDDGHSKLSALHQMSGCVRISFCSLVPEGKVDHRPSEDARSKRIGLLQRFGGGSEDLVMIAIQLGCAAEDEVGRAIQRRPVDQEDQGVMDAGVGDRK